MDLATKIALAANPKTNGFNWASAFMPSLLGSARFGNVLLTAVAKAVPRSPFEKPVLGQFCKHL
jgi:hypothetical protein